MLTAIEEDVKGSKRMGALEPRFLPSGPWLRSESTQFRSRSHWALFPRDIQPPRWAWTLGLGR